MYYVTLKSTERDDNKDRNKIKNKGKGKEKEKTKGQGKGRKSSPTDDNPWCSFNPWRKGLTYPWQDICEQNDILGIVGINLLDI